MDSARSAQIYRRILLDVRASKDAVAGDVR
jgi:hypothetical protein